LVLEWGISPRYSAQLPANFKIVGTGKNKKSSRVIKGKTADLSETGLGILSNLIAADGLHVYFSNDMTSNTLLEIEIELPERAVKLIGTTCRYKKLDNPQSSEFIYVLGVKIIEMAESDQQVYQQYVSNLKRDPWRRAPRY
jgi:c-di-GMP-binding flagellar brake protein YcgR